MSKPKHGQIYKCSSSEDSNQAKYGRTEESGYGTGDSSMTEPSQNDDNLGSTSGQIGGTKRKLAKKDSINCSDASMLEDSDKSSDSDIEELQKLREKIQELKDANELLSQQVEELSQTIKLHMQHASSNKIPIAIGSGAVASGGGQERAPYNETQVAPTGLDNETIRASVFSLLSRMAGRNDGVANEMSFEDAENILRFLLQCNQLQQHLNQNFVSSSSSVADTTSGAPSDHEENQDLAKGT